MRSTIKKDIWGFCLPAFLVFTTALVVCAKDVYDRIAANMGDLSLYSAWSVAGMILYAAGLTIALIAVFTL